MTAHPRVPLLDLRAQYETIRDAVDAAIHRVVESQHFVMGPEVDALEGELAAYCQVRHAVSCASGSDALLLALMALEVGPGDEVLCPAYTFFATAGSIRRLGARPVFADIEPGSYNLDPDSARRAATRCTRLKALLPVHLYGQVADLDAMLRLGEELDVPVVEDAAQAIGAHDAEGRPAGSRGRIGCFSFFPSKNLGAYGDGGMLTTNDPALAERLAVLRLHGSKPKYFHAFVGVNSRLDALQAAVLRAKLPHLDGWSKGRAENAAFYDRAFAEAGAGVSGDDAAPRLPLRTPRPAPTSARHIYNQYVIRVPGDRRDDLRAWLAEQGVGTEVYYPLGLHMQQCFADLGCREGELPETEAAARETLALPIYPELSRGQLDHVVRSVVSFLSG